MIKAPLRQIGSVARDVLLECTLIHRVFEWNDNAFSLCLEKLASNDKVRGTQGSVLYRDLQQIAAAVARADQGTNGVFIASKTVQSFDFGLWPKRSVMCDANKHSRTGRRAEWSGTGSSEREPEEVEIS